MAAVIHKFLAADSETLAAKRQVRVNCSSANIDREGDAIVQTGINTSGFIKAGGTVLWQHDQNHPIARALTIGIDDGRLGSLVQFPEVGISAKADEVYGLIKAGIVSGVSIGFRALEWEPLGNAWSGRRYTSVELCEFSFVSVPANTDATVIARSFHGRQTNAEYWERNRALIAKSKAIVVGLNVELALFEAHQRAERKRRAPRLRVIGGAQTTQRVLADEVARLKAAGWLA
jgi:HK97 family phage prohead protease